MERLKVAIAERILEISSENPENIKQILNKIQRFSDFAEACKTLMVKYPEIETELLEMVRADDFDASRASRRVDSIINREQKMPDSIPDYQVNQIPEVIPIITPPPADSPEDETVPEAATPAAEEDNTFDEILTEELSHTEETPLVEEIHEPAEAAEAVAAEEVIFSTVPEENAEDGDKKTKRKKQLTLLWQILAIAAAIFVIVIVVKFVVSYWKPILTVMASLLAIYLLWLFLKKRNKNNIN